MSALASFFYSSVVRRVIYFCAACGLALWFYALVYVYTGFFLMHSSVVRRVIYICTSCRLALWFHSLVYIYIYMSLLWLCSA